jgi:multicomponent Na+:H+ antiporter subunit F
VPVNPWVLFAAVLMVAGLGPALVVGARDKGLYRLAGLQLAGPVTVLALVAVSVIVGRPSYLIVPLALVLLSFAGTLVYTRLLTE